MKLCWFLCCLVAFGSWSCDRGGASPPSILFILAGMAVLVEKGVGVNQSNAAVINCSGAKQIILSLNLAKSNQLTLLIQSLGAYGA